MSPADRATVTRQVSIVLVLWCIIVAFGVWNSPFTSHAQSKGSPCQSGSAQFCIPIRDADRERFKEIQSQSQTAQAERISVNNWIEALKQEQETIRLRACLAAGLADAECGGLIGDKVGVNQKPADANKK